MHTPLIRRIPLAIVLFVTGVATVHADDAVVGTGVSTCDEAALDVALGQLYPGANFPGGTLTFNCGPSLKVIPISNRKSLTGATIVDGAGKIQLDGQNSTGHFAISGAESRVEIRGIDLAHGRAVGGNGGAINIASGVAVVLANLVISESSATLSGGGVHVEAGASLRVENSSFIDNFAANGGAIASNGALAVIDSAFWYNTANGGEGGAIEQWFADLSLVDVNFNGNLAHRGGALLLRGRGAEFASAQRVWFDANTATDLGGGVAMVDQAALIGSDVRFTRNHANYGAGLHVSGVMTGNGQPVTMGCAAILNNAVFEANEATFVGGAAAVFGLLPPMGGQYGMLHLVDARIAGNHAGQGGGIWSRGQLHLFDSVFDDNSAVRGGAMSLAPSFKSDEPMLVGFAEITRTEFVGNNASEFGGAIHSVDALPLLNQVNFLRNAAPIGGAILSQGFIAPLTKASFIDNIAAAAGGALYLQDNGSIQFSNLSFSGNRATDVGGYGADIAAESSGSVGTLPTQLSMSHSTLVDGHADTGSSLYAGGPSTSITLRNNIVLGAHEPSCVNNSPILSADGNFMPASCQPALANDVTVTTRAELGLSNLSNALGRLQVLVPQPASALIDHVDCPVGRDTDARGYAVPVDGDGDNDARCDSGAVERQPDEPAAILILFRDGFESGES